MKLLRDKVKLIVLKDLEALLNPFNGIIDIVNIFEKEVLDTERLHEALTEPDPLLTDDVNSFADGDKCLKGTSIASHY